MRNSDCGQEIAVSPFLPTPLSLFFSYSFVPSRVIPMEEPQQNFSGRRLLCCISMRFCVVFSHQIDGQTTTTTWQSWWRSGESRQREEREGEWWGSLLANIDKGNKEQTMQPQTTWLTFVANYYYFYYYYYDYCAVVLLHTICIVRWVAVARSQDTDTDTGVAFQWQYFHGSGTAMGTLVGYRVHCSYATPPPLFISIPILIQFSVWLWLVALHLPVGSLWFDLITLVGSIVSSFPSSGIHFKVHLLTTSPPLSRG